MLKWQFFLLCKQSPLCFVILISCPKQNLPPTPYIVGNNDRTLICKGFQNTWVGFNAYQLGMVNIFLALFAFCDYNFGAKKNVFAART